MQLHVIKLYKIMKMTATDVISLKILNKAK